MSHQFFKVQHESDIRRISTGDLPASLTFAEFVAFLLRLFPKLQPFYQAHSLSVFCVMSGPPSPMGAMNDEKSEYKESVANDLLQPQKSHICNDHTLKQAFEEIQKAKSVKFIVKTSLPDREEDGWDLIDGEPQEAPAPKPEEAESDAEVIEAPTLVEMNSDQQSSRIEQNSVNITHPNWLTTSSGRAQSNNAPDEKQSELADFEFSCSVCQQTISGIRLKCIVCHSPPFQLCSSCDGFVNSANPKHPHDPLHAFVRILHPDQCPDTGVLAKRNRNPFGVCVVEALGLPAGSRVMQGERFFVGWRLKNGSAKAWNRWRLKSVFGDDLRIDKRDVCISSAANQPAVMPDTQVDVLLEMQAPCFSLPGGPRAPSGRVFRGCYRLCTPADLLVGVPLQYEVLVAADPPASASSASAVARSLPPVASLSSSAPSSSILLSRPRPGDDIKLSDEQYAAVYRVELQTLANMGFVDRDTNLQMLIEGKAVPQVVEFWLKHPSVK